MHGEHKGMKVDTPTASGGGGGGVVAIVWLQLSITQGVCTVACKQVHDHGLANTHWPMQKHASRHRRCGLGDVRILLLLLLLLFSILNLFLLCLLLLLLLLLLYVLIYLMLVTHQAVGKAVQP